MSEEQKKKFEESVRAESVKAKENDLSFVNQGAIMVMDIAKMQYAEYKKKGKRRLGNSAVNAARIALDNQRYYIDGKYGV